MIDFFTNLVWPVIWPILSSQYFLGALTMQLLYTTQSFSTWLIQSVFELIKNAFLKQFVFAVEIFDGSPLRDAYSQHVTKRNQSAPSSVVFAKSVCEKIVFFNDADSHWVWLDDSLLTYVSHKDQVLTIRCAYGERERLKCILSSLVEFRRHCIEPSDKVTIWRFQGYQNISNVVSARLLSGIFLPKGVVENLVARLQLFFEQKHFYIRNNIPYRLGLLLHGVPGTGKTSLINALAAYFNLPIMVTDKVENLKKLQNAPARIVVLEDVDRIFKKEPKKESSLFQDLVAETNLCELLNFIDGLDSPQNQILIMTTNHIEDLDPALIRPGRIDVQIEFGYADRSQVARAIDRFYFSDIADSHQLSHVIGNAQSRLYAHKLCKTLESKGNRQFSMSALMQHFLAYPHSVTEAIDRLDLFPLQRKANVITAAISTVSDNAKEKSVESEKND
jgi:hypothetical protein